MASSARNETAPMAVLAMRAMDHLRAFCAVKRSAKSSNVSFATHLLYVLRERVIRLLNAISSLSLLNS